MPWKAAWLWRGGQPDLQLIAQWEAMGSEAFDLQYRLPGATVETYQQVLETYRQRSRELRLVVDRYMAA